MLRTFRSLSAVLLAIALTAQAGCYNTYNVTLEELGKAQEGGSNAAVKVDTDSEDDVVITKNSRIGVTDNSGVYHQISAFNFTLTPGQLVAPDEDLLLARSEIESGNVKVISGTKTALIIAAGVLAVLGAGVAVALTAEDRKEFGQ